MMVRQLSLTEFKLFATKILKMLPENLQRINSKFIIESKLIIFNLQIKAKKEHDSNPLKIYFISPKRIVYHTNYLPKNALQDAPFRDRIFPEKMRGLVVNGNWDSSLFRFDSLDIYNSFRQHIKQGIAWRDTEFYRRVLKQVESGDFVCELRNRQDLDQRVEYLDSVYKSIVENGYRLNRTISFKNTSFEEIDVNIGRNGHYFFQSGVHRLSIAKILELPSIPVMVFVRHSEWQKFRNSVASYAKNQPNGKLYQPIVHPDLADIPYEVEARDCYELMRAIKHNLSKKSGLMLDIGSNLGFFCHKFEDEGFTCYALENDATLARMADKIRIAENKRFNVTNKSVFDFDLARKSHFDVVLALNVFHHFLKNSQEYYQLIDFLKHLDTDEMYFELHQRQNLR